jgi:hypothetical protein
MRFGGEQLPGIRDLTRNSSSRYHDRTHQHGPASGTPLPALEVPVAGTGAKLIADKLIWIHAETHRATRLAPFKTSFSEDPIYPQFLARGCHTLGAWNGNGLNALCDTPAFDVFGDFPEVRKPTVGATAKKRDLDWSSFDWLPRPQFHVFQGFCERSTLILSRFFGHR